MEKTVSDAIMPLVNNGMLTMEHLAELIGIKEFVDRISTKNYINTETADELELKYGCRPSVNSWGDYFQAELATTLSSMGIEDFRRAVDTVRFDIISSYLIFSGQEPEFFEWVEKSFLEIDPAKDSHSGEDLEIIHLHILKEYFINLGIANRFMAEEMAWYSGYNQAQAI